MKAGVDYPLRHVLGKASIVKIVKGGPQCNFGGTRGLVAQKCRSCDRGIGDVQMLIKYGVRHYVCASCREYFITYAATHR